jgi:GntR family transcriptional regulator
VSPIDRRSALPIYRQIADDLRRRILSGELAPGAKIPTENELVEQYQAARLTTRQAVELLKTEGLLDAIRGRGVFVRSRPPIVRLGSDRFSRWRRQTNQAGFFADTAAAGSQPDIEVEVSRRIAPPDIAERMGLPKRSRVLVRSRRYLADGIPMQLATSYVPLDVVEGAPAVAKPNPGPGGIYMRMEEAGHPITRFVERITTRMPTPEEAAALQLGTGTPVLQVQRTTYGEDDRVLEVVDMILAGNRYELAYDIPGDGSSPTS